MLRVNDDRGVGVPLVPMFISTRVSGNGPEFVQKHAIPDFCIQKLQKTVLEAVPPPPVVQTETPRYKHRSLRHGPRA